MVSGAAGGGGLGERLFRSAVIQSSSFHLWTAVSQRVLQRLRFLLFFPQQHPSPQPVLADIDLLHILCPVDDTLRQEAPQYELRQKLRDTDKLHGQPVIDIDIDDMLRENGFRFPAAFPVPADIGIDLPGKQRQIVVSFIDIHGRISSLENTFIVTIIHVYTKYVKQWVVKKHQKTEKFYHGICNKC